MNHLQHPGKRPGGCWVCTHWKGETSGDHRALVCRRDEQPIVLGTPDTGCVYWEREPGTDDEFPSSSIG